MISPTTDSVEEVRLFPTPQAPNKAGRVVNASLSDLPDDTLQAATLLVSELVTNSVRHSGIAPNDSVVLRIATRPTGIRVEVADWGRGFRVHPRSIPLDQAGGWGLPLVARLAERWGVQDGPPTTVWFELT